MNSFCLKLVLALVAILAFNFEPAFRSSSCADVEITSSPTIDIDPLTNPSSRGFERLLNYIADPFIPIVVLVHSLYDEPRFAVAIPAYPQIHLKKVSLRI